MQQDAESTRATDADVSGHCAMVNTISEAGGVAGAGAGAGSRQSFQTLSIFNAAVSPVPINPSAHGGVVKCSAPPPATTTPPPDGGWTSWIQFIVSDRSFSLVLRSLFILIFNQNR